MKPRKLDDEQLAKIVGAGCYNPDHPDTDRKHLCVGPGTVPPPGGGRKAVDVLGGTGDGANQEFDA